MVDLGLHIMVVAEPASGAFLDWRRVLSKAAEQGAIVSFLEVRGAGAKWLVPAAPASSTASPIPVGDANGRAAAGSGVAVIDKLFEAQALVPAIRETELWLFAGEVVEVELADSLASETTIRLRVFEKGQLSEVRAVGSATGAGGPHRTPAIQATTPAPTGRSVAIDVKHSTRRSSVGLVTASLIFSALGFGAGWAVFGNAAQLDSNDVTGSVSSNESTAADEVPSRSAGVIGPGQCIDVPGYELLRGDLIDLPARVVDCDSATALTRIRGSDEQCENCQTANDSNGHSIEFLEIPRAGQCFFSYLLASGRGTGWPTVYSPCYSKPSQAIRDRAPDIAAKLGADASDLRLATLVIREVSPTEFNCEEGLSQWDLSQSESPAWICALELVTHG